MAKSKGWEPPSWETADDMQAALRAVETTLANIARWGGEIHDGGFEQNIRSGLLSQSPCEGITAAGVARKMDRLLRDLVQVAGEAAGPAGELADRLQGEYIEPIQDMRRAGVKTARNGLNV